MSAGECYEREEVDGIFMTLQTSTGNLRSVLLASARILSTCPKSHIFQQSSLYIGYACFLFMVSRLRFSRIC